MSRNIKYILSSFFLILIALYTASSAYSQNSDHLVINEIQVGSDEDAQDEFVELYNPTDDEVDLTEWRLARKTATATSKNSLISSMSGVIAAKSYLLVAHNDYDGSAARDVGYDTTSSITSDNTIYLLDPTGFEVDKVGMGAADDFETATTSSPVNGKSIQRVDHQDTDDNSVDFALLDIPTPHNSSFVEPTATAEPTQSPSSSPTASPTQSPVATETASPTASPTQEPTSTPTPSPSPTPTVTAEPTASAGPTLTPTPSPTSTPVSTPQPRFLFAGFFYPNRIRVCKMEYRPISFGFFTYYFPSLNCRLITL